MLLTLFILQIATVFAQDNSTIDDAEDGCATCIKVSNRCYNATYLFDLDAPFRNKVVIHKMGILRNTNTLFYSFEPVITDPEYYKVGFVNLDNESSGIISGENNLIVNFGTFDIDQERRLIYLGGDDGIFILDTSTNRLSSFSSRGDTILNIFFKGNVYFHTNGEPRIVVKKGDNFDTVLDNIPVKNFVINNDYVIVFLSTKGLFVSKSGELVRVSKNSYFRGLTIDLDGNVYAWWVDGIYKVVIEQKLHKSKVVKVADIPTMGAMTFDNENNILFNTEKSLIRLTQTNLTIC